MSNQNESVKLHSADKLTSQHIEIVKKNSFSHSSRLEIEPAIRNSCCGERTMLEKLLISLTVSLLLILATFLSVSFLYYKHRETDFTLVSSELEDGAVCISKEHQGRSNKKSFSSLCVTAECIAEAHRILSHSARSVNPCEDFFSYACGGWQQDAEIPQDQLYHAVNLNVLRQSVDKQLRTLLETPSASDDLRAFVQIKTFYLSCIKSVNFTENTVTELMNLVNQLGGYQSDVSWRTLQENIWDLSDFLLSLIKHNGAPLFDVTIDIDVANNSRFAIVLGLPRQYGLIPNLLRSRRETEADRMMHQFQDVMSYWYDSKQRNRRSTHASEDYEPHFRMGSSSVMPQRMQEPTVTDTETTYDGDDHHNDSTHSNTNSNAQRRKMYNALSKSVQMEKLNSLKHHAKELAKSKGILNEDVLNREVKKIVICASALHSIIPSQRNQKIWEQQNGIYNSDTINELDKKYNFINWKDFLGRVFLTKFTGEEIVYVAYPDYFKTLSLIIKHTEKRLLHNTLLSLYIRDVLDELMENTASNNRWKFCVRATSTGFGEALSGLYLRQFNKEELKSIHNQVEDLFYRIKTEVSKGISQVDWMDEQTRKEALTKVKQLRGNFVTPNFYFNNTFIEHSMKDFSMSLTDFFGNVMQMYKVFRQELYQFYHYPVQEETVIWAFITHPFVVNAFYIQQFNSIVLPLAILTPPHFMNGLPTYINYGALGTTLAHEILHGFDVIGHAFDSNGVLRDWWSPKAKTHFMSDTACVASFYTTNFHLDIPFNGQTVRLQFDGNFTVNENTADLGAFKYAYRAYSQRVQDINTSERLLPGVNLTRPQIFFLSTAQAYCSLMTPLAYVFLLELDDHTPHPERINGVLMNTPEFSEAFNCPVGSKMNPLKKCSIW